MEGLFAELQNFFFSDGMAGGLIGAGLLLLASYWVDVRLALQTAPLLHKLGFLGGGGFLAAVFDYSQKFDVEILICTAIGAGWPYLLRSLRDAILAYFKGRDLMKADQG